MSKAQETRANIIRQAAELFNQKGYAGSSISDIMEATGLKKGGIYNHFLSKEELALEAFDYAASLISNRIWSTIKTKKNALDRLQAMVRSYQNYLDEPPIAGGCPILNTAIESDDTNSKLRDRALGAMNSWHHLIVRIVQKGISKGEVRSTIEPDTVATIFISSLEGAIMMSRLKGDRVHLTRVIEHLEEYIRDMAKG